jgi:hypothetical protein
MNVLVYLAVLYTSWSRRGSRRMRHGARELCVANLNLVDPVPDRLALLLYIGTTATGLLLPGLAAFLVARQTR